MPSEIGQLNRLEFLLISHTSITTIPPEIGNLAQLNVLDLPNNNLQILPPEIGNLTELTRLRLARNQLTVLPPEMGNLSQLFDLDLSSNDIAELPQEFGQLSNLGRLDLTWNPIRSLPSGLLNSENLNYVGITSPSLPLTDILGSYSGIAHLYVVYPTVFHLSILLVFIAFLLLLRIQPFRRAMYGAVVWGGIWTLILIPFGLITMTSWAFYGVLALFVYVTPIIALIGMGRHWYMHETKSGYYQVGDTNFEKKKRT